MGQHRADAVPETTQHSMPFSDHTSSQTQPGQHSQEEQQCSDSASDAGSENFENVNERGRRGDEASSSDGASTSGRGSHSNSSSSRNGSSKKGFSSAIELSQGGEGYLAVGELSKRGRGRHTTTSVTLIRVGVGYVCV